MDGGCVVRASVVRPKTPRGDGNFERVTADGTIETSRQTQNPERGRKHKCVVISGFNFSLSSDPKPREGTETRETAPSLAGAA
ncbi:Uncharacterised protein [Mycobacterium tuberculosis]|nr:Uncharacterised protein [Mycobacterium tuberculosis]